MENPKIQFSIKLSLKDYRNFNLWHVFRSSNPWLLLVSCIIILAGSPFLLAFYLKSRDTVLLVAFVIAMTLIFFLLLMMPVALIVSAKSAYNSNKSLREEQRFAADEQMVDLQTDSSTARVAWKDLYKAAESRRYFFLYAARNQALIIPKEQLGPEQVEFLQKCIRQRGK